MKKNLSYYLALRYPILITEAEENGKSYLEAEIPELPGCGAQETTINEALEQLTVAKKLWIKARLKRNLPVPEPVSEEDYSGKFLLRIPPDLHKKLALGARNESLSLNQYIRKIVENALTLGHVMEKMERLEQEIKQLRGTIEFPNERTLTAYGSIYSWGMSAIRPRANVNEYPPQTVFKTSLYKKRDFTVNDSISGGTHENQQG